MELKVGMYVKYTRGAINGYVPPRIAKIIDCSDKDLIKIDNGQVILKADILKASYNTIDLIEENDILKYEYDNKICVSKVEQCGTIKMLRLHLNYEVSINCVKILEIQTKEQFENNVYRIGE